MVFNPRRRDGAARELAPALALHRTLPQYAVTALVDIPDLARELRVATVAVKDEEQRLGLPSFKMLGSSWAVHERIRRALGRPERDVLTLGELRTHARGLTLCTASDGNYGRSIAALAQLLGCASVIFLPSDTATQRIADVRGHGARVELVEGSYEDAVARARDGSSRHGYWYCPDTALFDAQPDELAFVRDVGAGYTTLYRELLEQLGRAPDVVFIQAGVGGLAAAGVLALDALAPRARIVTVEPEGSNCVQSSIAAGEPRSVDDEFTMMAGLRCQSVSAVAWPLLRDRVAAAVTVGDDPAADAMRLLARSRVVAGESGAAGVAGARLVLSQADARARLGVSDTSVVVAVNTEGATDRVNYERIVGAGT